MLVSIHQPNFLPWLRLLDKILASDVYIAYDTVQYTKSEYHARQKVKAPTGTSWLSLPLRHVSGTRQPIRDVRLGNSQPFRYRHLKILRSSYASTPYFDEVYPIVEQAYARDHDYLAGLNLDLIGRLCDYLAAPVRIVRASQVPHAGDRTGRLVQLVRGVGGTEHLTSTYGSDHQHVEWEQFHRAGIAVRAQEFAHPVYPQIGRGFVPDLAAVDMLFSLGRRSGGVLAERRRSVRVVPTAAGHG